MSGAPLSTADACTGTTDDDSNAEAMLSLLFEKCDEYRTGHVKSSCLVDKIRGWIWNNADADKRGLEDLRRRLNGHTNDEGSVTRGQFLEIAQEWLGTLMATKEQEQTGSAAAAPGTATTVNRTRIPVLMHHRPPKSLLPSFPPRPPTITNAANPLSGTPKSSLSEIMDASLGLLSPELLLEELNNSRDHTFGSMEGYGEDQHPQDPDPESVHEIECLTKVNKRLAEEKASLQAELTSMEDLVQMVKDENDNLKTSLKANNNNNNQHHGSNQQDSNLETGREDDCGKGESSIGVERYSNLRGKSDEYSILLDEKKRLESELRAAREALAVARHNEEESKNIALNYAKELEIKAVQAEEQAEDIKVLQDAKKALLEELSAVKGFRDNLAEEMKQMEQKFLEDRDQRVLASSSKYRRAERVFSSPDAPDAGSGSNNGTFDVSTDEVWVRNIQFTRDSSPMAVSTPFGKQLKPPRNSIGDEIIGLGELNDVSPLCGKSNNNNDDSDCSPIKNATDAADMPDANPDAFPPPSATAETSRGPEQKFEIRQEEGNEEEDIFLSGLGAGVVEVSSPVVFPVRRSEVGTQTDPLPSLKRKRVMFDDTEEDEVLKDVEETENGGKGSHWWSKSTLVYGLACFLVLSLILFTTCGRIEVYNHKSFYPVTWFKALGLPEPFSFIKVVPRKTFVY